VVPECVTKDDNKKRLVTPDRRLIECGHLDKPGSEKKWMGRPHDQIAFDEAAQSSLLAKARAWRTPSWNEHYDEAKADLAQRLNGLIEELSEPRAC